jgi:hypothetical protein
MTRVTAHYIRKMAAKYNIEIEHPLRSQKVKEMYVAKIAEAIIGEETANMTPKEESIARAAELQDAFAKYPNAKLYSNISYLPFIAPVYVRSGKPLGVVGVSLLGRPWYRFASDSVNVRRNAESITNAVDFLVEKMIVAATA